MGVTGQILDRVTRGFCLVQTSPTEIMLDLEFACHFGKRELGTVDVGLALWPLLRFPFLFVFKVTLCIHHAT